MAVTTEQQKAIDYLVSKHQVPLHAAQGIVAGLSGESGTQLNTKAINKGDGSDGSDSVGIAQWNSQRVVNGTRFLGKPLREANGYEQLDFLMHELNTTHTHAKDAMKQADNAADVTRQFVAKFEVPADENAGNVRVERYLNPLMGVKVTEGYKAPSNNDTRSNVQKLEDSRRAEAEANAQQEAIKAKILEETNAAVEANKQAKQTEGDSFLKDYITPIYAAGAKALFPSIAVQDAVQSVFSPEAPKVSDVIGQQAARASVGVGQSLVNQAGNVQDALDNTSVGNFVGVDNNQSALKSYANELNLKYDDGSGAYATGQFVGNVAPSVALGVATGGTSLLAQGALQGGLMYATSNDGERGTNALLGAGGTYLAAPLSKGLGVVYNKVVNKAPVIATTIGTPEVQAGMLLRNAGAVPDSVPLPANMTPTLGLANNTEMNNLIQAARSTLSPEGGVGKNAAKAYDEVIHDNYQAAKAALNPTGVSSRIVADDIAQQAETNIPLKQQWYANKTDKLYNSPKLQEWDANPNMKDEVIDAEQFYLRDVNDNMPSAYKPFVDKVYNSIKEVENGSIRDAHLATLRLDDEFKALPDNVQGQLKDFFKDVKGSMRAEGNFYSADEAYGAPVLKRASNLYEVGKQFESNYAKYADDGNKLLTNTKALTDLSRTPKLDGGGGNAGKVVNADDVKSYIGAKADERIFSNNKLNTANYDRARVDLKAAGVLTDSSAKGMDSAIKMLSNDLSKSNVVRKESVAKLAGVVGNTLDNMTNTGLAVNAVGQLLHGNILTALVSGSALAAKVTTTNLIKNLYIKNVSKHLVQAGVDLKYADDLVEKFLKTEYGKAQLAKLVESYTPVVKSVAQGYVAGSRETQ